MFNTILVTIVSVSSIAFISFLLGRYIYKRAHGLPTGDCACCTINKNKLLKQYRKKYAKK